MMTQQSIACFGAAPVQSPAFAPQHERRLRLAILNIPPPEVRSEAKPRRTQNARAALFIATFLFVPTNALACSCMRSSPEVIRQQAAVIIEGKVTAVSREGDINGRVTARIVVSRQVKGKTTRAITVSTRGNSAACGYAFKAGQSGEFLLTREQGRYTTNLCLMMGVRK
jgi:hypothetical protein